MGNYYVKMFKLFEDSFQMTTRLVCGSCELDVRKTILVGLDLFDRNTLLLASPYRVTSVVSENVFRVFVDAISGNSIHVTTANCDELALLCQEFGFHGIDDEIARIRQRSEARVDVDALNRIRHLERTIESMQSEIHSLRVIVRQSAPYDERSDLERERALHDRAHEQQRDEATRYKGEKFSGIIAYLTKRYGGNVAVKGVVDLTGKDLTVPHHLCNAVDLCNMGNRYTGADNPNQWLCLDFKERRVSLTHYSWACWHGKSWVLEGSVDGETWNELDRRDNNNELYGPPVPGAGRWRQARGPEIKSASFSVTNPVHALRFVRLRQTGKNHTGYDWLDVYAIELFGKLIEQNATL